MEYQPRLILVDETVTGLPVTRGILQRFQFELFDAALLGRVGEGGFEVEPDALTELLGGGELVRGGSLETICT